MERDPIDGKVTFVELQGEKLTPDLTYANIITGLGRAAAQLYDQMGFVTYPFVKVAEDAANTDL